MKFRVVLRRLADPPTLALAAVLVLALYGVTRGIQDPDFWWHLKSGQILVNTHHLIAADPFTYTVANHPWVMHEWLTEVLYCVLFAIGGLGLIVISISVLTWLGICCLAAKANLDHPYKLVLAAGIVLALLCGYPVWEPRPQMFDFAGVCLVLWLAERHLRIGGKRIWLLVPVFLVWSNLHSGFIIGIAFLLIIGIAEVIGRILHWSDVAAPDRIKTLFLVAIAALLVGVINPNGPGIILYPFGTVGSAEQQRLIQEWASPNFHEFIIRVGFAPMLASLVVLIILNRRITPRDAALAIATTAFALQSERNVALFAAAATPIWIHQADLFVHRIADRRLSAMRSPANPPPFVVFCSVIVLMLMAVVDAVGLGKNTTVGVNDLSYARDQPVCAARWLATTPQPLRIFNQYGEGGYLSYALSAKGFRVFIFGDAALMGDQLLINYGDVESLNPDWDSILQRTGTQVILFDRGTPLARVLDLSRRWKTVYTDPHSEIWVRTGSPLQSRLAMPADAGGARSDVCAQLVRSGAH